MAESLAEMIAAARARWMIGGEAVAPDHPLTAGATPAEADLRLLAVAGQFQLLRRRPAPPPLVARPDLPRLPLPLLPEPLRGLARRLLAGSPDRQALVATLAARRGVLLHPADWLPPPEARDLPEAYRPLQLWRGAAPETLTPGSWSEARPAARRAAVAALRGRDPEAARRLLEVCLAPCPAEERASLVALLGQGLSPGDAPFLSALLADRSEKVREAVARLLSRLGIACGQDAEAAAEAAGLIDVRAQGGLKEGQARRLALLLGQCHLAGLAQALGRPAREVVAGWEIAPGSDPLTDAILGLIAESGTEAEVAALWDRLAPLPGAAAALERLGPRMDGPALERAVAELVAQDEEVLPLALRLLGPSVAPPVAAAILRGPAAQRLPDLLRETGADGPDAPGSRAARLRLGMDLLDALGFLLPAGEAALLLERVTEAGLQPTDPRLASLKFNAALRGPE